MEQRQTCNAVVIAYSVLRKVRSLFQSEFSRMYDPVLPLLLQTVKISRLGTCAKCYGQTNFTEQDRSWDTDSRSTSKEILHILKTIKFKIRVFRDKYSCRLTKRQQRFGGACSLHLHGPRSPRIKTTSVFTDFYSQPTKFSQHSHALSNEVLFHIILWLGNRKQNFVCISNLHLILTRV